MMNAEELAQYLEDMWEDMIEDGHNRHALVLKFEAAVFIRDQQVEIERLKALLEVTA
jgi:hypothetical protein